MTDGRRGSPDLLIHQPSYSMLNRWIEPDLLHVLKDEGIGCIVFSPLAQGLLTDRYLKGVPEGSRASPGSMRPEMLTEENLAKIRALNEIAKRRGPSGSKLSTSSSATRAAHRTTEWRCDCGSRRARGCAVTSLRGRCRLSPVPCPLPDTLP